MRLCDRESKALTLEMIKHWQRLSFASALRQGRDAIANAKVRQMTGVSRERVLEVKAIRLELRVVNQAQQIA
jgi:hypothetical protein